MLVPTISLHSSLQEKSSPFQPRHALRRDGMQVQGPHTIWQWPGWPQAFGALVPTKATVGKARDQWCDKEGFKSEAPRNRKKTEGCLDTGTGRHRKAFWRPYEPHKISHTFNLTLHDLLLSSTETWARCRSSTKNHTKKGALPLPS